MTTNHTRLYNLSTLSSKDILSTVVELPNCIEIQNASKENKSLSQGADCLNNILSTKLTANRKPGGEKRKRDGSIESDNDGIMLTKKRRGGNYFLVADNDP